jgi:hypothetical protein
MALTCGAVVTLKAQDIYVVNRGTSTVGEYGLDGSTINASLISGLDAPYWNRCESGAGAVRHCAGGLGRGRVVAIASS